MAISKKLKKRVIQKARSAYEYCMALSTFSFHNFGFDHITPVSLGGSTVFENLAFCCQHCNNAKYNNMDCIDPLGDRMVSLFHPRLDQWSEHFIWSADKTIIIGMTPAGRATVSCLKMNRKEAINLRKALVVFDVHPPF